MVLTELRERVAQAHAAAKAAAVVLRLPFADLGRPVDHDRLRGIAPLQRGQIDEQLEQRSGLPLGLGGAIELAGFVVAPADQRQHGAVFAERDEGGLRNLLLRTFLLQPAFDHAFRKALQFQIERGTKRQVARRRAQHAAKIGGDHVDEIIGAGRRFRRRAQIDLLRAGGLRFRGGYRVGVHHGLQHGFLALLGAAEIAGRGQLRRRAHQAGEHRRLRQGEFARLLSKVSFGRGVHAVGAGAEIRRVQVAQEDLLLGQLALQPDRKQRLLGFAAKCPFGRQKHQPGELLRNGAAALARRAGLGIAPACAKNSSDIHAPVLVKPPVFDRDDGLGQMRRKILRRQSVALEDAARRKRLAFGALDGHRALGRLNLQAAGDRQRGNAVQDQCRTTGPATSASDARRYFARNFVGRRRGQNLPSRKAWTRDFRSTLARPEVCCR